MFCQEQRRRLTMDDLISRQAAIELAYFHGKPATWDHLTPDGVDAVDISDLEKLPAIRIEPKTGKWVDIGSLSCRCSECGCKNNKESNYCPECGAKMSLKEGESE